MAALPVSPEVAVKMTFFRLELFFLADVISIMDALQPVTTSILSVIFWISVNWYG